MLCCRTDTAGLVTEIDSVPNILSKKKLCLRFDFSSSTADFEFFYSGKSLFVAASRLLRCRSVEHDKVFTCC